MKDIKSKIDALVTGFNLSVFILIIGLAFIRIMFNLYKILTDKDLYKTTDFKMLWLSTFVDVIISFAIAFTLALILPYFELKQSWLVFYSAIAAIFSFQILRSAESIGEVFVKHSPNWFMKFIEARLNKHNETKESQELDNPHNLRRKKK